MQELTVGRLLRLAAESRPQAPALHFDDQTLTHGELNAWGNRIGNGLLSLGLKKGDRLGVMLPNSPLYVAIAYGAAKAGIALILLNYRFTGSEIAYHLGDAQARAIVFDPKFDAAVAQARQQLPALIAISADATTPQPAATATASSQDGAVTLDSLCAQQSAAEPAVDVRETDLLVLQYTSGTTGHPKGAIITHRNRSLAFLHWPLIFGYTGDDILLHTGPFHHSAPFGMVLCQLCLGGQVVVMPRFDAAEALALIERKRVTWSFMVPAMYNSLFKLLGDGGAHHELSSLKRLLSGASPLPTPVKERILQAFPNAGLFEFYGATEAGTISVLRPEDQRRKQRCVGKPVFGSEIKVVDAHGAPVAVGEVGEILLKTPSLFDGYHNAPEKTATALRADGWCTLGDLGRLDDEGYLYIVDRLKDVIKSGGVNIYPSEIEEAVLTHPDVLEAAVIGIPDAHWGEAVHAIVTTRSGRPLDAAALLDHCAKRLARYKLPRSVETRASLPHSPAGKILKRELRLDYWQQAEAKV